MEYNFKDIERKWQERWVKMETYRVVEDETKKKFYVLNMFPYPAVRAFTSVIRWVTLPATSMPATSVSRATTC